MYRFCTQAVPLWQRTWGGVQVRRKEETMEIREWPEHLFVEIKDGMNEAQQRCWIVETRVAGEKCSHGVHHWLRETVTGENLVDLLNQIKEKHEI